MLIIGEAWWDVGLFPFVAAMHPEEKGVRGDVSEEGGGEGGPVERFDA